MNTEAIRSAGAQEKSTKNPRFFQFYKSNMAYIQLLVTKNQCAARIFFFIITHMDRDNALIVSHLALEEALNLKRTSIFNGISYLKNNNYVKILKSGTSNIYFVNSELVWQKSNTSKKFAKFQSAVYITANEQYQDGKSHKINHFELSPKKFEINSNKNFDNERD
jgi:hypothetical protein